MAETRLLDSTINTSSNDDNRRQSPMMMTTGSATSKQPNGMFARIIRPLLAELMGTTFYLLLGMLVWCASGDIVSTAAAFGIGLAAYLACFGHISGGHFNPATTIAVFIAGEVHIILALIYIITQLTGGIMAAALTKLLWNGPCLASGTAAAPSHEARETIQAMNGENLHGVLEDAVDMAQNFVIRDVMENSWWLQMISEALLTLTFTFVTLMTTKDKLSKTGLAPFLIGLTLTACMLATGKISYGHLNPARSLGSAIFTGQWTHHYVYWAGPIIGAFVAGLIYRFIFAHDHYRLKNKRTR